MNGQIQYGPAASTTSSATRLARRAPRLADPGRFRDSARGSRRVLILVSGLVLLTAAFVAVPRSLGGIALLAAVGGAWLTLVLAVTLPGRRERAGAELARRLADFRHAVNVVGDAPTRAQLEGLLQFARGLELHDDEVAAELAGVRAALAAVGLRERLATAPPPVLSDEGLYSADDPCHFACAARLGRRRSDDPGRLLMTGRALRFRGTDDITLPWSDVQQVHRSGDEVIVISHDQWRLLRFACTSLDDAAMAAVMADHLRVSGSAAAVC